MYVDSSSITVNHKTYTRHLLRTSFRKDGKVKHRTIANISSCSDEEIQAVKLGLKYKGNLAELASCGTCQQLWDTRELHLVSLDYGGETREVGAIDINIDQDLVA